MNHRASAQIPQAFGWRRGDGRAWRVVEFLLAKKRLTNGGESPPPSWRSDFAYQIWQRQESLALKFGGQPWPIKAG